MTKRDFIIIARALNMLHRDTRESSEDVKATVEVAIKMIRDVLADSNSRFDHERFSRAVYLGLVRERPGTIERTFAERMNG